MNVKNHSCLKTFRQQPYGFMAIYMLEKKARYMRYAENFRSVEVAQS
ncbi:hypothetical protein T08_14219, partial [Trichinella sp. T8]